MHDASAENASGSQTPTEQPVQGQVSDEQIDALARIYLPPNAHGAREFARALLSRGVPPTEPAPTGWKLTKHDDGAIVVWKDGLGGYAATKDHDSIAVSILWELANAMLAAAPVTSGFFDSPQSILWDSPMCSRDEGRYVKGWRGLTRAAIRAQTGRAKGET